MIFELPDIFFGSHPKKEMASQPPQVRQYGFIKKDEKALPQAAFSKNLVISFSVLRAKQIMPNTKVFGMIFRTVLRNKYAIHTKSDGQKPSLFSAFIF